jgi:hypothetical protein
MGRCLMISLLTSATFIVLAFAIYTKAWSIAILLLIAYILWFWHMGRADT